MQCQARIKKPWQSIGGVNPKIVLKWVPHVPPQWINWGGLLLLDQHDATAILTQRGFWRPYQEAEFWRRAGFHCTGGPRLNLQRSGGKRVNPSIRRLSRQGSGTSKVAVQLYQRTAWWFQHVSMCFKMCFFMLVPVPTLYDDSPSATNCLCSETTSLL